MAVSSGDPGTVGRLLAMKANPNATDANGLTPLHYCADKGICRCAELLLEAGAALEAVDVNGNTPLHAVGRHKQAELYEWLISKAGADSAKLNAHGRLPKLLEGEGPECCVM
eukprot:3344996-Prymnesium_polylepis.2